jgi:hypothetical protein
MEKHNYIIYRSADYLNWKFCYPDLGNFKKYIVREDDGIVIYSVLRVNRYNSDYPVGYIVDMLAENGREDVLNALAGEAVKYFDEESVNIVNYMTVKGHPHADLLKNYSFLDSRIRVNMYTSQELDAAFVTFSEANVDPSTIYVSWGDQNVLPVSLGHHS